MSSCKGQLYSTDLVFAVVAFLVVLLTFLTLWQSGVTTISYFEAERWREEATRFAAEQLVETPGYPTHWEQIANITDTNVRSIGLAGERNVISPAKLQRFLSFQGQSEYELVKRILGVSRYEMGVVVENLDGDEIAGYKNTPPTNQSVSSVSRLAIYNGSIVVVRVYVWE